MKSILALSLAVLLGTRPAIADNWPTFRGPTGQGVCAEKDLPTRWSASENLRWKAEIPGDGWSSPIVWNNRVFLTCTTDQGVACRVIGVDADSGKVLWNTKVFDQPTKRKENRNSYATPTPATDGKLVYAVFGAGGIAALDFEGKIAWTNTDNPYYSRHGMAVSPRLYNDLLITPYDWSIEPAQGVNERIGWQLPWDKSFILALDKNTGKEKWRGKRGLSRIAHPTPLVVPVDGKDQLISQAGDVIQGFDPADGRLIWTVRSQGEGLVPSPVVGMGLLFTSSGFEATTLRTVKLGGAAGDVTGSHIAWEVKRNVPNIPSFIFADPHLFALKENGMLSCLNAKDGSEVWSKRLEGNFSASPVLAEGRLYILGENGTTVIIEAGPEYKEIARNSLGDNIKPVQASMAVSNGRLLIRTPGALWCVGK